MAVLEMRRLGSRRLRARRHRPHRRRVKNLPGCLGCWRLGVLPLTAILLKILEHLGTSWNKEILRYSEILSGGFSACLKYHCANLCDSVANFLFESDILRCRNQCSAVSDSRVAQVGQTDTFDPAPCHLIRKIYHELL